MNVGGSCAECKCTLCGLQLVCGAEGGLVRMERRVSIGWAIIPSCLAMASKEMWNFAVATQELILGMSFWESFP